MESPPIWVAHHDCRVLHALEFPVAVFTEERQACCWTCTTMTTLFIFNVRRHLGIDAECSLGCFILGDSDVMVPGSVTAWLCHIIAVVCQPGGRPKTTPCVSMGREAKTHGFGSPPRAPWGRYNVHHVVPPIMSGEVSVRLIFFFMPPRDGARGKGGPRSLLTPRRTPCSRMGRAAKTPWIRFASPSPLGGGIARSILFHPP